jgi:hypothetical protein
MRLTAFALLLVVAAAGFADDIDPWTYVQIDTNLQNVTEGQPATLRLVNPPPCTCIPTDVFIPLGGAVTWSFGDGSPDVLVQDSGRVTHVFPRGWFDVTARVGTRIFRTRIFSQAVSLNPPTYLELVSAPSPTLESAGGIAIQLARSGNLGVTSTVGYSISQPTDDYSPDSNAAHAVTTPLTGSVTFAPGETAKQIVIGLLDDALYEGTRYGGFSLWTADGTLFRGPFWTSAVIGGLLTIVDDDAPPRVSVADVSVEESDRESEMIFNVRLSSPAGRGYALPYSTNGITALPDADFKRPYAFNVGIIRIPAGATTIPLRVPIIPDGEAEADETFVLSILHPISEQQWPNHLEAVGTIINDDTTLAPDFLRVRRGTQGVLWLDVGNPVAAPATVALTSSASAAVGVPSAVSLMAGSSRVAIPFDALLPGSAYVEAHVDTPHGVVAAQARLDVVDATALQTDPPSIVMRKGTTLSVRLSFAPPVAEPHAVTLSWSGSAQVSIPATVIVPAGGFAEVPLHATSAGAGAVNASAPDLLTGATLLVDVLGPSGLGIESVLPASGPSGTLVTVGIAGLVAPCSVALGETPATTTGSGPSSMTVIAPSHPAGAVDVSVTCGTATATKTRAFTYTAARRRASH